eukprot:767048-Hanusia_phi.AAC.7
MGEERKGEKFSNGRRRKNGSNHYVQSTFSSLKELPPHFRKAKLSLEEQETINVSGAVPFDRPSCCFLADPPLARRCVRSSETQTQEVTSGRGHGHKDLKF